MDANGFRRCEGFAGSIPQAFINSNLPTCPLCGSGDPYWTLKDKIEMAGNRVMFRCKDCGGVLSATAMDFSGQTKSTAAAILTTGGAVNALIKHGQGKDVKTQYMRVDDAGSAPTAQALQGKELPLEQFQAISSALAAAKAAAPQPTYAQPQPTDQPAPQPTACEPAQQPVDEPVPQPADQPAPMPAAYEPAPQPEACEPMPQPEVTEPAPVPVAASAPVEAAVPTASADPEEPSIPAGFSFGPEEQAPNAAPSQPQGYYVSAREVYAQQQAYARRQAEQRQQPTAQPQPTPRPQQPNYAQPQQPNYAQPQRPSYAQPQQPNYAQPQQPNYAQPQQPNYAQPQQPNYAQPQQPNYAQPQQPNYAQPRQQNYAQPQQPNFAQPWQPNYAQPQQSNFGQPNFGQPPRGPQPGYPPYGYPQPGYPQPGPMAAAGPQSKLPLVFAIVMGACSLLLLIVQLINLQGHIPALSLINDLLVIGASVLMIIGLLQKQRGPMLYGIGVLIAATGIALVPLFSTRAALEIIIDILLLGAIVLPGLYYLLNGKLFGNPIKLICAIVIMALDLIGLVVLLINLREIAGHLGFYFYFIQIISLGVSVGLGLSILFHTPFLPRR